MSNFLSKCFNWQINGISFMNNLAVLPKTAVTLKRFSMVLSLLLKHQSYPSHGYSLHLCLVSIFIGELINASWYILRFFKMKQKQICIDTPFVKTIMCLLWLRYLHRYVLSSIYNVSIGYLTELFSLL